MSSSDMRYAIVIEQGDQNYSAYVPDLPGCVATGTTVDEVKQRMEEAVDMHVHGLEEDGEPVPEPRTLCDYVETAAAE